MIYWLSITHFTLPDQSFYCLQALRDAITSALCNPDLSATIKLLCVATTLEVWPELLLPSPRHSTTQNLAVCSANEALCKSQGLLMICLHAGVQTLVKQASSGMSDSTVQAQVSAATPSESGEVVTAVTDQSRLALHSLGHTQLAQSAVSQLQAFHHDYWQLQQQQLGEATEADTAPACPPKEASMLWSIAVARIVTEFRHLGTAGSAEESRVEGHWSDLQAYHAFDALQCQ